MFSFRKWKYIPIGIDRISTNKFINLISRIRKTQVVERQARDLEVLSSNYGLGSNFSLEFKELLCSSIFNDQINIMCH